MTASTALLTDIQVAIDAAPAATTSQTAAIAAAGPIQDLDGNLELVKLKFQEAKVLLQEIDKVVAAGDTALQAEVTDILASLT